MTSYVRRGYEDRKHVRILSLLCNTRNFYLMTVDIFTYPIDESSIFALPINKANKITTDSYPIYLVQSQIMMDIPIGLIIARDHNFISIGGIIIRKLSVSQSI